MTRKGAFLAMFLLVFTSAALAQTFGVKKRPPKPREYGNVTINNYSLNGSNPIAPVVFQHWLHRTKFTCRLCHVDLGFAMEAGGTEIKEEDNESDFYCGACHNGTEAFGPKGKDDSGGEVENCPRCHSKGEKVEMTNSFPKTIKGFPRSRFGLVPKWVAS
jgi:c(7)-type cytochrome triheme protein